MIPAGSKTPAQRADHVDAERRARRRAAAPCCGRRRGGARAFRRRRSRRRARRARPRRTSRSACLGGRRAAGEGEVDAAPVGVRVREVRHHEDVPAERGADGVVERAEARPRRGDLHRVAEGARHEDGRLPVAHAVAVREPVPRGLLAERARRRSAGGDRRGAREVLRGASAARRPRRSGRASSRGGRAPPSASTASLRSARRAEHRRGAPRRRRPGIRGPCFSARRPAPRPRAPSPCAR